MKMKVFTVYDSKAEAYMQPFFAQTKGAAIRSFQDAVNQKDHQFAKHPEDYTLFEIGEYDDSSAKMVNVEPAPVSLGNAIEFIKSN